MALSGVFMQFWTQYFEKDIEKLERIWRWMTKVMELEFKLYEERLREIRYVQFEGKEPKGAHDSSFKIFARLS